MNLLADFQRWIADDVARRAAMSPEAVAAEDTERAARMAEMAVFEDTEEDMEIEDENEDETE